MALAKRQKTATQLETLTEFAEHHLCSESTRCALTVDSSSGSKVPDLGRIEMLVDACLLLPQGNIMRDWSTIIALLLRESDDLISTALRPSLSAILLRIFVASALNLKNWFNQTKAAQNEEIDGMRGGKPRRASFSNRLDGEDSLKAEQWESLNSHLLRDLPMLLVRFRDDQTNLSVLVSLLCCCDVSVSNKALKSLLKSVINFFDTSSDILVIEALCRALREWMMLGGTAKGDQLSYYFFLPPTCFYNPNHDSPSSDPRTLALSIPYLLLLSVSDKKYMLRCFSLLHNSMYAHLPSEYVQRQLVVEVFDLLFCNRIYQTSYLLPLSHFNSTVHSHYYMNKTNLSHNISYRRC